ncbi:MAG: indole-3-glycerol phosphate synthase TrpC [bacterium]|nr:indole-3-glycerol phosphate synthase TrpC [bacterium]
MPTILNTIAAHAAYRVAQDKLRIPAQEMRERALALGRGEGEAFRRALAEPGLSVICEVKKASPSRGVIAEDFPYLDIAREYAAAGADAISCLTEPKWFLGSDRVFAGIRAAVHTPMLRKDFVVDDYQLYQSRCMGANAVLLICALHDTALLKRRLALCEELGLCALVETHDEGEIASAVAAGARVIGVNNRNLHDFTVDLGNAERLRALIPPDALYVAESGVQSAEQAQRLHRCGADAVLVGEALMRSTDRRGMLHAMKGA